jgi:nucleoside-diphosphate-sugar epimerase
VEGDLAGRRISLIGGAGFIGHNLAIELTRRGAAVEIIDSMHVNNLLSLATDYGDPETRDLSVRMIHERLDLLRQARVLLHPQDARDYHAISRLLNAFKPHVIVHLAAVSHAGRSNKDPYSTFDHSLRTLENALDAARGLMAHFVFLSSSMAYGNFLTATVEEDHPLNPIGIYGALKVAGEKIVIAYQQVFDLPYTIVRPSALYGPRCVSRRVVQIFIENAMRGRPLDVQGEGDERLDFTYIDDLVQGLCLTVSHPGARNEIFNLTHGGARTIHDLVGLMREHFPGIEVHKQPWDKLMPHRGTLSVDKATRLLGYQPSCPLEVGLPRYLQWYRALFEAGGR